MLRLCYYCNQFSIPQLTWADIALGNFLDPEGIISKLKNTDLRHLVPQLMEHAEKVNALPKIRQWMEERPKSER